MTQQLKSCTSPATDPCPFRFPVPMWKDSGLLITPSPGASGALVCLPQVLHSHTHSHPHTTLTIKNQNEISTCQNKTKQKSNKKIESYP